MNFLITLTAVASMLFYAIPGYIFIKTKLIDKSAIPAFAMVLMYMCQPGLTVYSFSKVTYSRDFTLLMLLFFAVSFLYQLIILLLANFIITRFSKEISKRILAVGMCFGNCGFLGVPLLEALLPENPEAVALSAVFVTGMNILGWTIACYIITGDRKFISLKKVFINPTMLSFIVVLPVYFFGITLPDEIMNIVTILAKMTTPLCMVIMGMRLATMPVKELFTEKTVYLTVAVKQLLFPLGALLIVSFLPLEPYVKKTLYILCATPVASITLNFAEMYNAGQKTAAKLVLFGTGISILTIPLMMLLV